jgi:hypothetical protein
MKSPNRIDNVLNAGLVVVLLAMLVLIVVDIRPNEPGLAHAPAAENPVARG